MEDFNLEKLAIENACSTKIFDTNLIYQVKEENEFCLVSIYILYFFYSQFNQDYNIEFSLLQNFSLNGWKLSVKNPNISNENDFNLSFVPSISFMIYFILSILISKEIPHNIIITDKGLTTYIIPRKFYENKLGFNTTWLDIAGLPVVYDEKLLNEIKKGGVEVLENKLKKELSLEMSQLEEINNEIKQKFIQKFEINN
jgi:hypothetical protein